jgi:hypothetical protein
MDFYVVLRLSQDLGRLLLACLPLSTKLGAETSRHLMNSFLKVCWL